MEQISKSSLEQNWFFGEFFPYIMPLLFFVSDFFVSLAQYAVTVSILYWRSTGVFVGKWPTCLLLVGNSNSVHHPLDTLGCISWKTIIFIIGKSQKVFRLWKYSNLCVGSWLRWIFNGLLSFFINHDFVGVFRSKVMANNFFCKENALYFTL